MNALKRIFADLDPVLHERGRLAIASVLAAVDSLTFTELRDQLEMTDGKASMFYTGRTPWHGLGQQLHGRPTVRELQKAGHDVVGLVRSNASAKIVADLGAEPVRADVLDAGAVAKALDGVEAVANLVGALPVGVSPDQDAWSAVDRAWRRIPRGAPHAVEF